MSATLTTILQKVVALIEQLETSIRKPRRIGTYGFLTVISAVTYAIVFSYFTVIRHNSFYSACWDLGIFNQAFYATISEGKLFYYTAELFLSPSGSLFAIHVSPILFLFLPIYAASPSPATLLVFKSFAVGLAAIPFYLLAKELLKSGKASFLMALVYLLYSPLQGANWFDFQPSAFLPLLLFLMYFFMIKKNWKLYFPVMLLTLMVEEHVALIVAIFAIYYFSIKCSVKSLRESLSQFRMDESLTSILTIAISMIYVFTVMLIKSTFPVNPDFAETYRATENFSVLGSSDVLLIPVYALLNPQRAFEALIYDYPFKFLYVVLLFGPLLFIPLKNRFSFGVLFLLMPFLLSNYRPYYLVGVHYPFFVLPILFVAAVHSASHFEHIARMFNLKTMIIVTLLFTISTSPLSPISKVFIREGSLYYSPIEFSLDENKKSLNNLLDTLPSNASVLTQNLIFPHVSNRINAYAIPFTDYGRSAEMHEYIDYLLSNCEYVLLDTRSLDNMTKTVLSKITDGDLFGPYTLSSQAILFKRGYRDEPIYAYYTEHRIFEAYDDLSVVSPPGSIVDDLSTDSGKVFFYPKDSSGTCVFGPYVYLLQGAYEATFTVKAGEHFSGCLGTFDIASDLATNILSFRDVFGFELNSGEWTDITVPLSLPRLETEIEFRVVSSGAADIYVDRVSLRRVSSDATTNRWSESIRVRDLRLRNGNMTEEGFLIHQRSTVSEIFWYGPYTSLSPGNYSATFLVRTLPSPQEMNRPILTLSISGRKGEATQPIVLKERTLYTQDFVSASNTSDWQSFKLDFTVENPLIDVEFRGLLPSADYDVYLASIMLERFS